MKQLLFLSFSFLWLSNVLFAQKRPSPPDEVAGQVENISINIAYSQPSVKGREIWGGLVPYNNIWRAGANEATVVSFDKNVLVNGKYLPKGKYAFFLIPKENEDWIAIFNSEWDQWGAYKHDEKKDVLKVTCTPVSHEFVEQMKFEIEDSKISLLWEALKIPLEIAPKSKHD